MTPKERAAMQQALEALELFGTDDMAYIKSDKAITALREALAESQVDWKEEAMRLGGLNAKHVGELRKLEAEQTEQEPVAWAYIDADGSFMDALDKQHGAYQTPLYAAPVRTKELTDDELNALWENTKGGWLGLFRAVIAAYKEKNK